MDSNAVPQFLLVENEPAIVGESKDGALTELGHVLGIIEEIEMCREMELEDEEAKDFIQRQRARWKEL